MQNYLIRIVFICLFCATVGHAQSGYGEETIEQKKRTFLEKVFQGSPPEPGYLWITASARSKIEKILLHEYRGLRIKYWEKKKETVWILEDIAKEKPVYAGIITCEEKISHLDIVFSSGRWGKQVQNANFTDQFENIGIDEKSNLNKQIDGISGATLSVDVVSRLARLALLLEKILKDGAKKSISECAIITQ